MIGFDTDEATVYKSVYVIASRRSASLSHRIRAAWCIPTARWRTTPGLWNW